MTLYVVALFLSPLAVWICGRGQQAWLNLGLWVLGVVLLMNGFVTAMLVPVVDALFIVYGYHTEKRLRASFVSMPRPFEELPISRSRGIVRITDPAASAQRVA